MSTKRILPAVMTLAIALLVCAVLALPKNGDRSWGTLSNDWTTETFGWPFEIWSKTLHSYRDAGSPGWVVKDTRYSVYWGRVSGLYLGAISFVAALKVSLHKLNSK